MLMKKSVFALRGLIPIASFCATTMVLPLKKGMSDNFSTCFNSNLLDHKNTQIVYTEELPDFFDAEVIKRIYDLTNFFLELLE